MKIKADKHITQEVDIDILGITLLSEEEAKALPSEIRNIGKSWWLSSPGYDFNLAALVDFNGDVYDFGYVVDDRHGVRPALEVGYEGMCMVNPRLDRGAKINLAGHTWTVISDQYILCDDIVGEYVFRNDWKDSYSNDYEKSDVKKFLEDWFDKNVKEVTI